MKRAQIINIDTGHVIAESANIADNFFTRLKGLMGRKTMRSGEALVIYPCSMVHCLGMKISIDVLFVTDEGKILKIIDTMKPGQLSPFVKGARYVIELAAGEAARTATKPGDCISCIN